MRSFLVDCGEVPRIEFGTVTAWVTTDGAVATYSCDFGYEFNGTISEVTCKGGSWKAEGPIACILKGKHGIWASKRLKSAGKFNGFQCYCNKEYVSQCI